MLLKCRVLLVSLKCRRHSSSFVPEGFVLIVLNTNILHNVADTHPVVEIRLLPYALQPVYMSLTVSAAKGKWGRGISLFVLL